MSRLPSGRTSFITSSRPINLSQTNALSELVHDMCPLGLERTDTGMAATAITVLPVNLSAGSGWLRESLKGQSL